MKVRQAFEKQLLQINEAKIPATDKFVRRLFVLIEAYLIEIGETSAAKALREVALTVKSGQLK